MKYFVLILICATINSLDDTNEEYRKQYGMSFHKRCGNYYTTFKCMTACKSMGFQVFRLDYTCKCTCHELKTTSVLPAFVWRTNGTTKKIPATFSPKLYAVVGTLSPPPTLKVTTTTRGTLPTCQPNNNTVTASTSAPGNSTKPEISTNTVAAVNVTASVKVNVNASEPSAPSEPSANATQAVTEIGTTAA